jgi:hypothetical protein
MSDLFGQQGQQLLERTPLCPAARARVNSAQRIITALDFEIDTFADLLAHRLHRDPGYTAIQQIPGVGRVLAAVFVAEIGQVDRFSGSAQLASWAGLTPKHYESDTTVPKHFGHRGWITKQGSRLVRWAAVEAVQRVPRQTRLGQIREDVGRRRGRNIGVVAPPASWSGWSSTACAITTSAAYLRPAVLAGQRGDQPRKPRWARAVFVSDPRSRRGRPLVSGPAHRNRRSTSCRPRAEGMIRRPYRWACRRPGNRR